MSYGYYAAALNFAGADSVKAVSDKVRVSAKCMIPFGALLASGAVGLLAGLAPADPERLRQLNLRVSPPGERRR